MVDEQKRKDRIRHENALEERKVQIEREAFMERLIEEQSRMSVKGFRQISEWHRYDYPRADRQQQSDRSRRSSLLPVVIEEQRMADEFIME